MRPALSRPAWIEVSGFKSIREPLRVELRPLTLLAGANSSGKSSFFQPLLLLKQSLEAPYEPDPLVLDGPHVSFTSYEQFLSRGRRRDSRSGGFRVEAGPLLGPGGKPEALSASRMRLSYALGRGGRLEEERSYYVEAWSEWVREEQREELARDGARMESLPSDPDFGRELLPIPNDGDTTKERRHYLNNVLLLDFTVYQYKRLFNNWLASILHIPGYRGYRERSYKVNRGRSQRDGLFVAVGPMHPYAASMLLDWQRRARGKGRSESALARERLQRVDRAVRRLGLTWKVRSRQLDAATLEIKTGRMREPQQGGAQDLVEIADVGFGVSQVLPVVVALAAAVPGQLVLLEQPELHLHPRAQWAMGELLAEAAARGVLVVAETHSPLLLRAAQTAVALGRLPPEQVGLHWFQRDEETGWSGVRRAELAPDGSFGDWPVDFAEVEAQADLAYLDAAWKRGAEE